MVSNIKDLEIKIIFVWRQTIIRLLSQKLFFCPFHFSQFSKNFIFVIIYKKKIYAFRVWDLFFLLLASIVAFSNNHLSSWKENSKMSATHLDNAWKRKKYYLVQCEILIKNFTIHHCVFCFLVYGCNQIICLYCWVWLHLNVMTVEWLLTSISHMQGHKGCPLCKSPSVKNIMVIEEGRFATQTMFTINSRVLRIWEKIFEKKDLKIIFNLSMHF